MTRRAVSWAVAVASLIGASGLWAPHGWAQDPAAEGTLTDDEMAIRNEGAHRFRLPKDWPVERRDGHVSPVNVETYLSMKFGQVKRKFGDTDQRLKTLEQRIAQLEQANKDLLKWFRLFEAKDQAAQPPQEVSHGDEAQVPEAESPQAPNAP